MDRRTRVVLWRLVTLSSGVLGAGGCAGGALGRVEIAPTPPEGLAWSDDLGEVIRTNAWGTEVASAQATPR